MIRRLGMGLHSVSDIRLIELPRFAREDGELVVFEGASDAVPFAIARVFTVSAPKGAVRGRHAHRACSQLMLCASGDIGVACTDGVQTQSFRLNRGNLGLLVPPSIWAEETWHQANSVLLVLCDRAYDEVDYVRDMETFLAWRRSSAAADAGSRP